MNLDLLTIEEAARYLKCTVRALQYFRSKGTGPSYLKLSTKQIRYKKSDLDSWLLGLAVDSANAHLDGFSFKMESGESYEK